MKNINLKVFKKTFFVAAIIFIIGACLTGCDIEDRKNCILVKYNYQINSDEDFKSFVNKATRDRLLYIRYQEDFTIENIFAAIHNSLEEAKPKYTVFANTTQSSYYSHTTAEIYEHRKKYLDYQENIEKGSYAITLADTSLIEANNTYRLFKERPEDWELKSKEKLIFIKKNKQSSKEPYTLFYFNSSYNTLPEAIYQENFFLEDFRQKRYKPEVHVVDNKTVALYFPYHITEKDPYVRLIIYDFFNDQEEVFTWCFDKDIYDILR
ncbi:hypothetical protein ACFLZV_05425 [Candidatus Margulisiibacteriota bacterium]